MSPDTSAAGEQDRQSAHRSDGRLDLKSNKLVTDTAIGTWNGTAYTGVQGEVARAYDFGSWDLPGLMTSMPDAGPLVGTTTIGVSDGATVAFLGPDRDRHFRGQTITGASTLAVYTYAGDVNFDGLVDASDYGIIDNYFQFPGTTGYANGDFNYDGVIDAGDYGIIDNTFQLQGAPIPMTGGVAGAGLSGVTAVPEPTTSGLLLAGRDGSPGASSPPCAVSFAVAASRGIADKTIVANALDGSGTAGDDEPLAPTWFVHSITDVSYPWPGCVVKFQKSYWPRSHMTISLSAGRFRGTKGRTFSSAGPKPLAMSCVAQVAPSSLSFHC
jgi:hypothetical protein